MKYRIKEQLVNSVESDARGIPVYTIEFCHVNPYGREFEWQPLLVLGYSRKFYNKEEAQQFLDRVTGKL